ncbi:hypothetical protein NQT72_00510 [Pseudoalteromonas carrageenovora]|uniref:hypothetical protein n=1 Tax=Pseudoalteromonas carrageenovora TaxID=227 RepID=UPI0021187F6F|nr:hypothetical protein [Pseudoalteromonas carrageenovora]MCQ8888010.1 hypothetical protein [Pseudoalteromonas carrageenovora]
MAKRMIKFTPIAASVALTLGLTACGSDNDRNVYVPPVESVTSSDDAQFNVEVTGKAVKGAMKGAVVSVMTLNATGESVPVAFRLEASTEAETFTGEATSQEAADEAVEASKLAGNPDALITNDSGRYSIYLEDNFSGPVYITVSTSEEGDDSFLRCDAYVGCGTYDEAPEADDVNDGDTNIEFGEWYKTDLELSVVKYVAAAETDSSEASGAAGDSNVARSFKANVTFLTTLVAQALIEAEGEVDADAIASTSLNTVIQVLGPDAAILLSALIGDLSNGGAVDLSDVDGEEALSQGILAIAQLSSSIQGLSSISEVMTSIKEGIKAGTLSTTDVAATLQAAVRSTASVFVAIATGDEAAIKTALEAAYAAKIPTPSAAEVAAFAENSAGIATKAKAAKDKAVKNGAATDAELAELATAVQTVLEELGCTGDECVAGDDFFAELAVELSAQIDTSSTELSVLQTSIDSAEEALTDVQEMGAAITDAISAIEFVAAVAGLENEAEAADLATATDIIYVKAQGYVSTASLLVAQSSDYQGIQDSATDLQELALVEVENVSAYDAALAQLVLDAENAITQYEITVEAAKEIALNTADVADVKKTAADMAEATSTSALATAEDAMVDTAENAAEAQELAMNAVEAASEFAAAVDALEIAIAQALAAANDYLELEGEGAQAMVDALVAMQTAAEAQGELANEQFVTAYNLQITAEEAVAKFAVLTSVKATSESLSTMTVLTNTGGQAVIDAADVLADVIDELADMGNSGEGTSTRQPEWDYNYSLDDLTLVLTNDTTDEMISAAASYQGEKLVVAWGATLVGGDATVELMTADTQATALQDCVDFSAGTIDETQIDSCLIFTFDGEVDADTVDDAEIVNTETWNHVEIMDGESGFAGMLNITDNDATDMGTVTLEGMSGDLDFKVMGMVDSSGDEDESTLDVMVKGDTAMGYTLSLTGMESEGYTGDVKAMYNGEMMSFGTATKVTNGVSITYIDGDVVPYTDVDLIDVSK